MTDVAPAYAVTCYTCFVKIWEGDTPPIDGQVALTTYADSTPGTACPSKIANCPNKTAVVADITQKQAVTRRDLAVLVAKIEAKIGKLPT